MKASIVMATCNRPLLMIETFATIFKQPFIDYEVVVVDDGDDELTTTTCKALITDGYPVKYTKLNRPQGGYKNPALPLNVGIRKSIGDIVILQNPECMHMSDNLIESLCKEVGRDSAVFCRALSLNPDGSPNQWYCHGVHNPRPFFFCGGIRRKWLEKLRGFDEDFRDYGYEDDDLAYRLTDSGVEFKYSELEVRHQWHPSGDRTIAISAELYGRKREQYLRKEIGIERNLGREWGVCDTAS